MGDEYQFLYASDVQPPKPDAGPIPQEQLPPLTDEEQARIEESRRIVHQHIPEMVDFIKDLHSQGLIRGWRDVHARLLTDEEKFDRELD